MKKQLTFLCALLFLIMNNLTAQHYQFPNPSFNNWTSTTSDKAVPRGWHSFSDADCQLSGLAALGCSTAKTNHSNTAADRFGATQHACQIYSKNILNTNANGAMTLGKMIIGDTDAESDLNLIYTKTSDADSSGCKWSMAGRPDSVRLWVRFDMASSSVIATCKMHIHGNVNYQDIPSHGAATAQTGKIANAFCEMVKNQGVVKYYNSENQWNGWERFDFKFTYYDAANNVVAQPTPSNITQATTSYILASFSTNKVVGGGSANDKLYFDDLELVYNKKLASLSIGGTNIPSADLVTLNNTAFNSAIGNPHTAYNIFNTQGLAVYDYNQPVCAGAFPEVSATAESGLINGITYTEATVSNPYTTIVVTHNDGSYYTYKVHFTNVQSSPNVTLDNGGNYSVCQNGSLTMTASGNAASYAWSNGLGNINTATPPTGTVGTTTYTVTGYSSNGCPTTATATVTVNPLPSVTLGNNAIQTVCANNTIQPINVNYSGGTPSVDGLGLQFNNSQSVIQGTPNASGQYTITVTSNFTPSCGSTSASGTITVIPQPVATLSQSSVTVCEGMEITPIKVTTSGGSVSYTLPAGLTYNNDTISGIPTENGTISFTTTSENNCGMPATATCSVTLNPSPSVTLSENKNQTLCSGNDFTTITVGSSGGTATVSGLNGTGLTYSNGQITGTPNIGTYTYYVTVNSNTCGSVSDTGTIVVNANPTVTLTPSTISVCQGSTIEGVSISPYNNTTTISGLPAGVSFDNTTGLFIGTPSDAGSYPITVSTGTNCGTATTTGTITVKPLPTVTLSNSNIEVCEGEQISSITVTTTNCENSNPVNLLNGLQFSGLNNNSGTITGIPSSAGTFTIDVNSSNLCGSASAEGTVSIKTKPTVSINGPESLCLGTTGTLTAEGNFTSCVWDDNTTSLSRDITPDHAGQFIYNVTATGNGCTNNATTTVNVQSSPAAPTATPTSNSNCHAPYNGSITVTSPTGNYTYSIDGTNFQESTTFSGLAAGPYTLTVKNAAGCTSTAEITVGSTGSNVNAQATANSNTPCAGSNLQLTGTSTTPDVTYSWTSTNGFESNDQSPTINNVSADNNGTYTLVVTETATGCTNTASVIITVTPLPTVSIASNPSVCPGTNLNIMIDGQNGSLTASDLPVGASLINGFITGVVTTSGVHTYTVTNSSACGNVSVNGTITVYDLPTITFTGNNSFCAGLSTNIGVQEAYNNYIWSTGSTSQNIPVSVANTYAVTVTDGNGCQNNSSLEVIVNTPPAAPTVSITDNTNCEPFNGSITVTAPLGEGYTYSIDGSSFQSETVFTGLESDEYTIIVQDNNGCRSTTNGVEVGDEAPYDGYTTDITVDDAVNSYVWNGTEYTESGNYTESFTASNGCDSTVTLHLTVITSMTNDIYETACDSYQWGVQTFTQSGNYEQTFVAVNGMDSVVTLHLTILKPAVTLSVIDDITACAGDDITLNAELSGESNGNVSFNWTGPNYTSTEQNINLNDITTAQDGEYTVTATATLVANDVTCTASDIKSVTVTVNTPAVTLADITDKTACAGDNVSINATLSGTPSGTVSYSWTGPDFTSDQQNITLNGITADQSGEYTVVATAAIGNCTATDTKTVNVTVNTPNAGTIAIDGNTTICQGESTTLTASVNGNNGSMTYAWSNNAESESITVSENGNYTVTATATVGECTATAERTVNVTVNNPVVGTITISGNTIICQGESTTLTASVNGNNGEVTFAWSNDATGEAITVSEGGNYIVTATATIGECTATATKPVSVTVNALPVVEITGETSFCQGGSTTLTASEGYTYEWNDQSTNPSISATQGGEYSVTVTDGNGCQSTASVNVEALALPDAPDLTATENTSCTAPNGVITVNSPLGDGLSYSINGTDFQTDNVFNGLNAGDFTVTVKNGNGCVNTAVVSVSTVGNTVDATASANTPCAGEDLVLNGSSTTAGVSYSWTGPNNFSYSGQNPTIANASAALNGEYTLTVTENATHCSKSTTVIVSVNTPAVTLADITDKTACAGDNVSINATLSGTPSGTVSYSWTGPDFTSDQQNITLSGISADQSGEYTVVATAAIGNCTATDSKTVNVTVDTPNAGTIAIDGNTTICQGESTTLTASVNGNNGSMTYAWSNNAESESITVSENGNYTVTATATVGECTATAERTVNVTVNNPVVGTITISGNTIICQGESTTLTASVNGNNGEVTFAWSNDATGEAITVSEGGNYIVTATATIGECTATATKPVSVTVNALPVVEITGETSFCQGGSTTLTASEGYTYEWNDQSTNPSISATQGGEYSVTVTDGNGCQSTASVNVEALALPDAPDLTATENTSCTAPNGVITVNSPLGDGLSYSINGTDFQTDNVFNGLNAGDFTVTVKNGNGCVNTAVVSVSTVGNTVDATASANTPCAGEDLVLNGSSTTAGVSYSWTGPNNFSYSGQNPTIANASAALNGEYTLTVTENATHCSKSTTVIVSVNTPAVTLADITDKTACAGDNVSINATLSGTPSGTVSYSWNGPDFTSDQQNITLSGITADQSGEYTVVATAAIGNCTATDTKTVNVTVNIPTTGDTTATACESFNWYDHLNITESCNNLTHTLEGGNINGCDSIVTLNLTINHGTYQTIPVTANNSYTWHGETYYTSGTHTYDYVNEDGCPSTDTLDLTILGSTTSVDNQTACNSYEWINGETYTESTNTPTVTLQAANGADSIVVLNLTILKPAVGTLTISGNNAVCQGSSTELTASVAGNNGNVTYVWSNDQTDATITVNPTETFDYTVSATATLTANGVTCTATDNATFTVTVNTPTMGDTTATACESFDWYEHTNITASCNNLTHTLAGANINGCDSIVTLNLTINHGTYQTIPVTANNSYTWHGETYYTSGTHTYDYVNEDGCPSTDTLDLTILGSTTSVDNQTACNSYEWINGETYTESTNTPTVTLQAANGADSIVVLNLTILKPAVGTLTISGNNAVCQGSSTELTASVAGNNGNVTYVWSTDQTDATITVNPTETTEYSVIATATLTANDVTCNATAEEPFTVTVNMPTTGDTTATACESFNWYDHLNITASCSNLTHTLEGANINGCDSIVTLNLTINHGTHNVEPVTANNSYTWHGETYNTSGIQTYDYVNEYGCPSTDTLYLTILDAITTIDNQTACNSYEWIDGETYTESTNTPTVTLQAANGADSIVVLNLTILKPSVGELTIDGDIVFCQNGSTELTATTTGNNGDVAYSWSGPNGFTSNQAIITATEGGDYIVTAMATLTDNGVTCNATSEESFTVTVNVPTSGDTTATACETFDWYEHINITESGDFTHTLAGANINGCDSVVTLHLTINHNVTADTFAVECNTFDWYDHTNITESCDNLTHTFQMANGCDSIVTLHLTILKPTVGTLSIDGDNAVCEGGNVTLTASANGNNGDITYVWSTQYNGETITDTPTESTDYTVTATATLTFENLNCFATGNVTFHVTMNTPTTGTDTRTACDSLKWLDNETYYVSTTGPTFPLEGANINGCDSIVTLDLTINYSSHFAYTEIECDEFVWHGNYYTTSGTHLYEYTNEEGCPSVDTLYLTIKHGTTGDTTAVECETFDWYEHTNITESCDNLTHTFEAANGCDSIVTLHLTILKPSVGTLTIDGDNAVCQGGEVTLTASANDNNGDISYVWSTQNNGETITDTPTESTDYTVTATATLTFENLNCFATGNVTFHVTMNTPTTGTDTRTACDSLKWLDNETYYVSTTGPTFPLEGANINGCDSIVTLDLTINYSSHFAYTEIECDEFVWHGNSYTTSGTHLYEYTNEKGCPSVDTLHLTIKHGTTGDTTAVECETFDWYEYNNITESGDYTHAFPMANGCDSVVTLHITINKPVEIDTTVQVCFFPYTFEGREYNEPTTDEFTITTIDGSCDSILYHLTVSIISSLTVDGHEYPVVKIGSDCWFAENLRIEEGLSDVSTYMNDESYVEKFGRLYNWYDAIGETQPQVAKAAASETAAGACPEGWTIPTVEDFENLIAMADNDIAKLKSPDVTTWLTGSAGYSDGIGFNAPAGGFYNPASLQFERLLLSSQYWTSTSGSSENHMTSVEFGYYCSTLLFNDTPKNAKLSIRCIKIK